MRTSRIIAVLTVLAVLVTVACGGGESSERGIASARDTTPSTTTPAAVTSAVKKPTVPQMRTTIHLEGAVSLDGDYLIADTLMGSCSAIGSKGNLRGAGAARRFNVPLPQLRGGWTIVEVSPTLDEFELSGFLIAAAYAGPGEYAKEAFNGSVGESAGEFMLGVTGPDGLDQTLEPRADSSVSLVVEPDGSGRLDFAGVTDSGADSVNGFIEWTCVEA